jgi:hypothetical protein
VPQELGAALDVLAFHAGVVETELNAATDNPLVFADGADDPDGAVLHGGNFYGQHVAFASDALATAVIKLAAWSERALARLVNPATSRGLPAFLHGGPPGLSSGLMGAQVTATALVAEMRSAAVPASIQTIPTNNDNQDVVTMGTIAARKRRGSSTWRGRCSRSTPWRSRRRPSCAPAAVASPARRRWPRQASRRRAVRSGRRCGRPWRRSPRTGRCRTTSSAWPTRSSATTRSSARVRAWPERGGERQRVAAA